MYIHVLAHKLETTVPAWIKFSLYNHLSSK